MQPESLEDDIQFESDYFKHIDFSKPEYNEPRMLTLKQFQEAFFSCLRISKHNDQMQRAIRNINSLEDTTLLLKGQD